MPGLDKVMVQFGWTMWLVLALSPASLSVPPSNGTIATVSMQRMQGLYAAVSMELGWV